MWRTTCSPYYLLMWLMRGSGGPRRRFDRSTDESTDRQRLATGRRTADERRPLAGAPSAEDLHLDQVIDRRQRGAGCDIRADEVGSDVERLELDQLVDRKMAVAETVVAADELGRDVQRLQLHQVVGRHVAVTDADETSDPLGRDVQRLELDQRLDRAGAIAGLRHAVDV